jgi:hypothetical protein
VDVYGRFRVATDVARVARVASNTTPIRDADNGVRSRVSADTELQDLQTSALPLGYVADVFTNRIVASMPGHTDG